MQLDKNKIKEVLKHRDPFLFVDEVIDVSEHKIKASYILKKEQVFFSGHFPDNPIMPGVLLIEAVAQASGIQIVSQLLSRGKCSIENIQYDSYLAKLNSFKFKEKIIPDAILTITAEVAPTPMENLYEVRGQIYVNNKLKAFGSMLLYFQYSIL